VANLSPDDLMTAQQIVNELQGIVTVRTVTTWCKSGRLKAKRVGLKWVIRRADFEAFQISNEGGNEGNVRGKVNALAA
jgi:hypothetical protein